MGLSLNALCTERKKTARDLAQVCGVHPSQVYRWLGGDDKPAERHVGALSELLGKAEIAAYMAAWPVLARGRPLPEGKLIFRMRQVARAIREKGHVQLADELDQLADATEKEANHG